MKTINFECEDFFPVIPDGRNFLIKEKANIGTIMEKVISINKKKLLDVDIEFIKLASRHASLIDIENYDAEVGKKSIHDDIDRGYDLVIMYCVKNKNQDFANLLCTFKKFLLTGEVRKYVPSVYYFPNKERDESIARIRTAIRKDLEENARKEALSIELAKKFRTPH